MLTGVAKRRKESKTLLEREKWSCRATKSSENVAGECCTAPLGDRNGRKCRLRTRQSSELYVRLLIKQFGGLSEKLVDGFFVVLRFCLTG